MYLSFNVTNIWNHTKITFSFDTLDCLPNLKISLSKLVLGRKSNSHILFSGTYLTKSSATTFVFHKESYHSSF